MRRRMTCGDTGTKIAAGRDKVGRIRFNVCSLDTRGARHYCMRVTTLPLHWNGDVAESKQGRTKKAPLIPLTGRVLICRVTEDRRPQRRSFETRARFPGVFCNAQVGALMVSAVSRRCEERLLFEHPSRARRQQKEGML